MTSLLPIDQSFLEPRLAAYLRELHGDGRPVTIGHRLSGGWSVDTYGVRVGSDELVLRIADAEHPLGTSPAREARILEHAAAAGVPVPTMVCAEDDATWLGGEFSLVSRVEGVAPNVWNPRRMEQFTRDDGGAALLGHMLDLIARVREIDVAAAMREAPSTLGLAAAQYTVANDVHRWTGILDSTTLPRPLLDLGARWLSENVPTTEGVVFQHHDYRVGNVLFDAAGRPTAVLDWEFCGAGDPLCDLGYAAQPYTLGRLLSSEPSIRLGPNPTTWMLDAYADRQERPPDRARMRYFVALGIFKMAVALVLMADQAWRGRGSPRERWLELPILSLSDDLVEAIRMVR